MRDQTSFQPKTQDTGSRCVSLATLIAGAILITQAVAAHSQLFTRGNQFFTAGPDLVHSGDVAAVGDFNDDGFGDLATGIYTATAGGATRAGKLQVRYGSSNGLGPDVSEFHQGLLGVPGVPEVDDFFATRLEAGDFNGDGYADLAVGVPFEDLVVAGNPVADAGAIEILYGSSAGLTGAGAQLWSEQSTGIGGVAAAGDHFGKQLSAGDFNGDGFSDLAIGAPDKDIGSKEDAGMLWILFGGAAGLTEIGSLTLDEADAGGTVAELNLFGGVLATGDFDDDGYADLAAGVPAATASGHSQGGVVWIFAGAAPGLTLPGTSLFQGKVLPSGTVAGVVQDFDHFGASLAIGDFNRLNAQSPRYQDLAIGVIGEANSEGAIEILNGSANGISALDSFLLTEADMPFPDPAPYLFGGSLAAGSLHTTVRADLVAGAPFDQANGVAAAGRFFVLRGSSSGLVVGNAISSATPGLQSGPPTENEVFGGPLLLANFDGRAVADLVVGIPGYGPFNDQGLHVGGFEILYSALFAADFETHDFAQWSSSVP